MPPGLLDEERRRGDVPRLEVELPEAVVPPARDVAQVEGRGARPPDRARDRDHAGEGLEVARDRGAAVGEAGPEHRLADRAGGAHVDGDAVEGGATAAARREALAARGIEHHAELDDAVDLERDRDRVHGHPVGVVHGAVERIDDPAVAGVAGRGPLLLTPHHVVGEGGGDRAPDGLLRQQVDLGHQVGGARLGGHVEQRAGVPAVDTCGGVGGTVGDFERFGDERAVGHAPRVPRRGGGPARSRSRSTGSRMSRAWRSYVIHSHAHPSSARRRFWCPGR